MVLKALILVFAYLEATAAVDCGNFVTGDPCSCNGRLFIEINDNVTAGKLACRINHLFLITQK